MRKASGFTIIEILIVVGIIGILTTIGFISFGKYQADTRDRDRSSKATVISEALEKYYNKNGEYPSCADLTGDAATVAKDILSGIDVDVLKTPQSPDGETNSIRCDDLTDPSQGDYFAYASADTSAECIGESGTACVVYTLKYIKEDATSGENIQSIDSRYRVASGSAYLQSCNGSSFTQIGCSWSPVSGASSYSLRASTSSTFASGVITKDLVTSTSGTITGLAYNTSYYVQVRPVVAGVAGEWSDSLTATTYSLGTPTCSTTSTISSITCTWGVIANATSYTVEHADNSSFNSSTVSTGITGTSKTVSGLAAGYTLYFRVKAVNGVYSGAWSSTAFGNTVVPAPTSISATANSTTQITASWSTVSVATSYDLDYSASSTFASGVSTINTATTSQAVTGLTPNVTYYFRVRAKQNTDVSANSSTASALTPTPNVVLSGYNNSCRGTYSGRTAFQLWLGIQEVSYNLAANQSNVNWTLFRYTTGGYASYDQTTTWPWGVNVNGTGWGGYSNSIYFKTHTAAGGTEVISSGSLTVTHNTDGTKTISLSGSDGPGGIFGSASCSNSYTLSDLR